MCLFIHRHFLEMYNMKDTNSFVPKNISLRTSVPSKNMKSRQSLSPNYKLSSSSPLLCWALSWAYQLFKSLFLLDTLRPVFKDTSSRQKYKNSSSGTTTRPFFLILYFQLFFSESAIHVQILAVHNERKNQDGSFEHFMHMSISFYFAHSHSS